ncbi:uncharacterized protein METZ01_LOCUS115351 [marine metagenome]|uniref:5-amino-6-(5-phosphoribosylamino)uracil reductase n=1 Tax=marine metagenome TaxID=408172 RepID=A0A381XEA6_9ZZZZ
MEYMNRALELARDALGTTSPNPAVGAVLVNNGNVVGEGFTQPYGGPHAEVEAIRQAGHKAKNSTIYVTLEPHCFQGSTPSCTSAIINAGIDEVHIAALDPNPKVNGLGKKELENAGLRVIFEESKEALEITEGFAKHIRTNMPFVTVKFAMSLDGKISTHSGDSKWITGESSRAMAHELRRISDAVMIGSNTVLRDCTRLTARNEQGKPLDKQPLKIVVDSHGKLPDDSSIFKGPGETLIATTNMSRSKIDRLTNQGITVVNIPQDETGISLTKLLEFLGSAGIVNLLVEGGGTLIGSFFDKGLVDKIHAFLAPIIIGGRGALSPVEGIGAKNISQSLNLANFSVERIGSDLMLKAYPHGRNR